MRTQWTKHIGLLLLCIFAAAIIHQALPHHLDHGNGQSCSLCVLLFSSVVLSLCGVLVLKCETCSSTPFFFLVSYSQTALSPYSLRAPPSRW